ncbi:hypothetical protein JAAARDRAFT_240042 [Jaapia argillacea MUCL 33604]|uniref:Uncharacterized protein n=1 Tax=Jaapia argillacea MUCL 33604 TaxID=933084 RepID=A0A067QQB7_9AGAM|nr:hypothetical protein JAAARDRAFT_240042 [Jaapia argillacea MUCL 33604]
MLLIVLASTCPISFTRLVCRVPSYQLRSPMSLPGPVAIRIASCVQTITLLSILFRHCRAIREALTLSRGIPPPCTPRFWLSFTKSASRIHSVIWGCRVAATYRCRMFQQARSKFPCRVFLNDSPTLGPRAPGLIPPTRLMSDGLTFLFFSTPIIDSDGPEFSNLTGFVLHHT